MDVLREDDRDIAFAEKDILALLLVKSGVGCGIILRDGLAGAFQRAVAQILEAFADVMDVGVFFMGFKAAVIDGFRIVFLHEDEDVVPIDIVPAQPEFCYVVGLQEFERLLEILSEDIVHAAVIEGIDDHEKHSFEY